MARKGPSRPVQQNLVCWYASPAPEPPLVPQTANCFTEALEAATASLSVEAQKRAAKDAQKKAAKAEAAEAKHADKLANSVVTIKRIERNKKKFVTAVHGLEAFGLDLKKVGTSSYNVSDEPLMAGRLPRTSARSSLPVRP